MLLKLYTYNVSSKPCLTIEMVKVVEVPATVSLQSQSPVNLSRSLPGMFGSPVSSSAQAPKMSAITIKQEAIFNLPEFILRGFRMRNSKIVPQIILIYHNKNIQSLQRSSTSS